MPILNWLTREEDLHRAKEIPFRILNEKNVYGDTATQNMLIQGDNLDVLKALLPQYEGKIKCIFIDPPYNIGAIFEKYDDNLEHSTYLSIMYPRLELLKKLLKDDGFFILHINDSEAHYLKILCDEIFGRKNYDRTFYIKVRYDKKTLKQDSSYHKQIEQALIYKSSESSIINYDNKIIQSVKNYYDFSASFGNCRSEGGVEFRNGKKPEHYLKIIIEYFTNPGDIVLDSFLGSGTTAAVAHKMRRRYIGIEIGEQAITHCIPRLQNVIDGEQGGISKAVDWKGGGGFRFYRNY